MTKNILIIHYNTPTLTECLVRSVNRFVDGARIYIFDNSTVRPFTAKFENVTLLNNTEGQIIDFDKWLEKYPSRYKSNGRVNQWGSAKHCYSVEKCMDLIGEPFVLLDSDVLLKKDISELFDEKSIYIGEDITQPMSTVKRTLPFICYINVKMCKDKNVHYFDDNYMHGLYKTPVADRYDTGAGFYMGASKYPHKSISCNEYVVHYGSASWKKPGLKNPLNPEEWLLFNRKYWSDEMNKKVVYTCITGGYDTLRNPSKVSMGFDYICFTDDTTLKSDIWDIRPLPKEVENLSPIKKQRYIKINPHIFLKNYDLSIWVDGNISLKNNLNHFLNEKITDEDVSIYVPQHPDRECIYDEAKIVISMRKDTAEHINPQMERYKKEGFPAEYGLLQSNIIVRRHNNPDCIRFMEEWSNEVMNGSHRDQLSFNYVSWKNSDIKVSYLDKKICKSLWFDWRTMHVKNSTTDKRKKPSITATDRDIRKQHSKELFNSLVSVRRNVSNAMYSSFNQY